MHGPIPESGEGLDAEVEGVRQRARARARHAANGAVDEREEQVDEQERSRDGAEDRRPAHAQEKIVCVLERAGLEPAHDRILGQPAESKTELFETRPAPALGKLRKIDNVC